MRIRLLAALITSAFLLNMIGCIAPATSTQQPAPAAETTQVDITLTIDKPTGSAIKPLLGVNAGPLPAGTDPANVDLTGSYRQVGVNLIRTHDYYGALDMSTMYPVRTADPVKAQSYNFSASDQAWRSIVEGGFEPYFRLGDSWNDAAPPANARERANWVRAVVEVLRHYRSGKWNGFNTDFRYVEIWNEPDNAQFWPKPHTPLEYFQLYSETALTIKHEFPKLKIGGPGLTPAGAFLPQGRKWTQDFLDFVRQKNAPLDFFSWHMYSNTPQQYAEAARFYRTELDARGFTQTSKHITEWNTEMKHGEDNSAESIALRTGSKGAAILSAAWIELQQQNDLEVSTFYRGGDTDIRAPTFYGLFYADGRPKSIASAFSLWSKMTGYSNRLAVNIPQNTALWALAGINDAGQTALLIANPGDKPLTAGIAFADMRKINQISLYKVSGSSHQAQTASLNNPSVEIAAESVLLLTIDH